MYLWSSNHSWFFAGFSYARCVRYTVLQLDVCTKAAVRNTTIYVLSTKVRHGWGKMEFQGFQLHPELRATFFSPNKISLAIFRSCSPVEFRCRGGDFPCSTGSHRIHSPESSPNAKFFRSFKYVFDNGDNRERHLEPRNVELVLPKKRPF